MREVADIVAAEITGERGGEVHRRLPLPDVRQIAQTCRQFVRITWPAAGAARTRHRRLEMCRTGTNVALRVTAKYRSIHTLNRNSSVQAKGKFYDVHKSNCGIGMSPARDGGRPGG